MLKSISFLVLLAVTTFAQDSAKYEAQVWSLEKAYWEYVKANDLEKYRALWHENFLGWPYVSSAPVRKDHITDWITANTSKGVKLQSYSIEQLAIQGHGGDRCQPLPNQNDVVRIETNRHQNGNVSHSSHLAPQRRHVANSGWHVRARERRRQIS
jgi:hypothetical protein